MISQTPALDETWVEAFLTVFDMCKVTRDQQVIILSETASRPVNVALAGLALSRMGVPYFHLQVPTPRPEPGPIVRSTGASMALTGQDAAVKALAASDLIVDLTVEGLMHARETADILKSGARIMNVSNEHPEALARLVPTPDLKDKVKEAVGRCRSAERMTVHSDAGTDLTVTMTGAATVGIWGWTDRPGTLAHWPGGIIVSFPAKASVNGRLAFKPGDINLTFKRYFESTVTFTLTDDYVTGIEGRGSEARLMRAYLDGFGDRQAYATSHVGWGLNPGARYEALEMYDKADTNGTELRAVPGNFLYSTGANEFAGRFTRGHFDLPMMDCTIALDGTVVVDKGVLVS
ncbi:MAG: peptidase M29 [Pseudomonadota bacterium]